MFLGAIVSCPVDAKLLLGLYLTNGCPHTVSAKLDPSSNPSSSVPRVLASLCTLMHLTLGNPPHAGFSSSCSEAAWGGAPSTVQSHSQAHLNSAGLGGFSGQHQCCQTRAGCMKQPNTFGCSFPRTATQLRLNPQCSKCSPALPPGSPAAVPWAEAFRPSRGFCVPGAAGVGVGGQKTQPRGGPAASSTQVHMCAPSSEPKPNRK